MHRRSKRVDAGSARLAGGPWRRLLATWPLLPRLQPQSLLLLHRLSRWSHLSDWRDEAAAACFMHSV